MALPVVGLLTNAQSLFLRKMTTDDVINQEIPQTKMIFDNISFLDNGRVSVTYVVRKVDWYL